MDPDETIRIGDIRLMGAAEIAALLNVTTPRVHQIVDSRSSQFPASLASLKMGKVYLAQDVLAWAREHRPSLAEDPEGE